MQMNIPTSIGITVLNQKLIESIPQHERADI